MSITLQPELQAFAEERARQEGLADASAFVNLLLRRTYCDYGCNATGDAGQTPEGRTMTRGERAVERIKGTASRRITFEEIAEITRSEI